MEGHDDLRPIGTDRRLPPTCSTCGQPFEYGGEFPVNMPAFDTSPAYTYVSVAWVCRRCERTQGYMKDLPD
jgi:hypothetical protein